MFVNKFQDLITNSYLVEQLLLTFSDIILGLSLGIIIQTKLTRKMQFKILIFN